ncbi:pre-tRNA nuclear export protein [Tulasnella sp. UAMH 9824]|nr:pre-tRNA nuclear export protein [Tulasnella sp. UAMH 9824]
MEAQILSAIRIAADPSQDRALQAQAVEFLNIVRGNARESCGVALTLFLEQNPDGSRKHDIHVRGFALQLLDDFLGGLEPLDPAAFATLEQSFVGYIQSEYIHGSGEASAPFIRNKFSHTLALLFLRSYPEQWTNFFPTIYSLLRPATSGSDPSAGAPPINGHVSLLFLRLLIELSGEVHDSILKGARTWAEDRQARDSIIRQKIRQDESENMNSAVLTIISEAEERLVKQRQEAAATGDSPARVRERAGLEEVVESGMKAFAGYCQWIDINLTINQHTVPLIFRLLADPSSPIRQATAHALLKIVQRGLKEPSDKLQLIRVLSLGEVLEALERKSREGRKTGNGVQADEEEEHFRESLGKLACGLGKELVDLIAEPALPPEGREMAEQLLMQLFPTAIQLLADEYDDTSSTILPLFTIVFSSYKKAKKADPQFQLTAAKRQVVTSTLEVIVQKMKWDKDIGDDEDDFEDMDDDDKGAFEKMRVDLRNLMDSILNVDEQLVTDAVRTLAVASLSAYGAARASGADPAGGLSWQDAELAVYLVYVYGELKPKGKVYADQQRKKDAKLQNVELPATPHDELILALVQSGISSYPHVAVRAQFFESVGRYVDFFKDRKECIIPVLEALVDQRGMHQPKKSRRGRVYYIFYRFIKQVQKELPQDILLSILNSIKDLLELETELPPPDSDANSSAGSSPTPDQDGNAILEEAITASSIFDSQLYLFETTGILISTMSSLGEDEQFNLLQAVLAPLLSAFSQSLQTPMKDSKDVLPVFKAHHLIQALASIVKGFPDVPTSANSEPAPAKRFEAFKQVAEAVLVSLEAFGRFKIIRDAARFAFTRLVAGAGVAVAQYIPTLTSRLLTADCDPSEIVELLSFLGLVFHRHLGAEVIDMLDQLLLPLTTKVSAVITQPVDGTDAQQANAETKKAYLDFILSIATGPLVTVFISPRNLSSFPSLVEGIVGFAADTTYPPSQRTAISILANFCLEFGPPEGALLPVKKPGVKEEVQTHYVPGFEQLIYDRLIPLAFSIPLSPGFNWKDGLTIQVTNEIGVMLKATYKARGQEVLDFLANSFLPSQNAPQETIVELVTKLQSEDQKAFRKYFTAFLQARR